MKKILVTGVTGKSGRYFYQHLQNNAATLRHYHFYFVVRNKMIAEQLLNAPDLNQTLLVGDLEDFSFLTEIFNTNHFNTLLHIAGIHVSDNLVKVAVEAGTHRLILVHTTGIYSKYKAAGEWYRQVERRIEKYIAGRDVLLTYLRPTMIYGNLNDRNIAIFMKMVDKLRVFPVVDGAKYELQPVWCGDLGKAYFQVLMNPTTATKRNYNLSGGKPILLLDMLRVMARYLGVKNRFVSCPFWLAYSIAWALFIASIGKIDYRERVQRLVEPRTFDHSDAARDFGYAPIPFEEGVKDEINQYLASK